MSTRQVIGVVLIVGGALVTVLNVYLSWIRVPLQRRIAPGRKARWVSGIPIVGSGALWLSAMLLPISDWRVPVALALSVFDTGGLHWFAGSLMWQRLRGSN